MSINSPNNEHIEQTGHPVSTVLVGIFICLTVAGLLSSARLVEMSKRKEFGSNRDRWVSAAEKVDNVSSAVGLDRPATILDDVLYDEDSNHVVLGDLSANRPNEPGSSDLTTPRPSGSLPDGSSTLEEGNTPVPTIRSSIDSTTSPSSTTLPTPTTSSPSTTPHRPISAELPLRIWTGGDSLGEYVGSRLEYKIVDPDLTEVTLDYHISTGLTRPDYFDWPATLSNVMLADDNPLNRPDAVIYMVGGNDNQPMRVGDNVLATNSPEWLAEYRSRVGTMMDITGYKGLRFYWVGLPPMQDETRESIAVNVNAILASEAANRDWVTFVDIAPMLSNDAGGYEQFITWTDGKTYRARESDGVHITSPASQWISANVWTLIRQDWQLDP